VAVAQRYTIVLLRETRSVGQVLGEPLIITHLPPHDRR